MENVDDYIWRTVAHEYAHLVDHVVHPENFQTRVVYTRSGRPRRSKRDVHGPTWQNIMRLFDAPVSRCHTYDVTNAQVRKKPVHIYICKCGDKMELGPTRHKRHQAMVIEHGRGYWKRGHARCGGYTYQGLEGASVNPTIVPAVADNPPPKPKGTRSKVSKGGRSKIEHCRDLWDQYNATGTLTRKAMIEIFINEAGCTKAGASTYHHTIKKEKS